MIALWLYTKIIKGEIYLFLELALELQLLFS